MTNTQAQIEAAEAEFRNVSALGKGLTECIKAALAAAERAAWQPEKPPTVCPHCGKPASDVAYGGTCQMGGCPLGGDL